MKERIMGVVLVAVESPHCSYITNYRPYRENACWVLTGLGHY